MNGAKYLKMKSGLECLIGVNAGWLLGKAINFNKILVRYKLLTTCKEIKSIISESNSAKQIIQIISSSPTSWPQSLSHRVRKSEERSDYSWLGSFRKHKPDKLQIVGVNSETVTNVTSTDFPGHYPGEDHAWSLTKFKKVRKS